jgi:hypothetical protein
MGGVRHGNATRFVVEARWRAGKSMARVSGIQRHGLPKRQVGGAVTSPMPRVPIGPRFDIFPPPPFPAESAFIHVAR